MAELTTAMMAARGGAARKMQLIRRQFALADKRNPWDLPEDGSLATFSTHGLPIAGDCPLQYQARLFTSKFNFLGARTTDDGLTIAPATTTYKNGTTAALSGVVEIYTDARIIEFGWQNSGGSAMAEIDGVFVSKTPLNLVSSGGVGFTKLTFPDARPRLIRLHCASPLRFIATNWNASIWKPNTDNLIRAAFMVDSYGVTGAGSIQTSMTNILGYKLGIRDLRNASLGGTGWRAPGPDVTGWKCRDHLSDATGFAADIIFFAYSNDGGYQDGLTAEVLTTLRQARAALPNALLIVFGAWSQNTGPGFNQQQVDALVAAAVAQFNDPYCAFIPVSPTQADAWVRGTGGSGSPYSGSLTATGALSAATGCTLNAAFAGPTASGYTLLFSDGTSKTVSLTHNSTAVTWTGAVTATASFVYTHANAGNADLINGGDDGTDNVHPNSTYGHPVFYPKRLADAVRAAVAAMAG